MLGETDVNASDLRDAIHDWHAGTIGELEALRLKEQLRASLAARQAFVEYGDLLATIECSVAADRISPDGMLDAPRRMHRGDASRTLGIAFCGGFAAACLGLVLLGIFRLGPPDGGPFWAKGPVTPPIAVVEEIRSSRESVSVSLPIQSGAEFFSQDELNLDAEDLFVRLKFAGGAELVLQTPVRLTVDSDSSVTLSERGLLGIIPPSAAGFAVHTPLGTVTDLGTEFALFVDVDDVDVSVFSGLVECQLVSGEFRSEPRQLQTGENAKLDPVSREVAIIDLPPPTLRKVVEFHSGIVRTEGAMTISTGPPTLPDDPRSHVAGQVMVFRERRGVPVRFSPADSTIEALAPEADQAEDRPALADSGLFVIENVPSSFQSQGDLEHIFVDSYLVRLRPPLGVPEKIDGSITFQGTILGVISQSAGLDRTDALLNGPDLAAASAAAPQSSRGLESGDTVNIDQDGRTVSFSLRVGGGGSGDEFRILVASPAHDLNGDATGDGQQETNRPPTTQRQ